MCKRIFLLVIAAVGLASTSVCNAKIEHILPKPKQVTESGASPLSLSAGVRFVSATTGKERVVAAFKNFMDVEVTDNASAIPVTLVTGAVAGSFNHSLANYWGT